MDVAYKLGRANGCLHHQASMHAWAIKMKLDNCDLTKENQLLPKMVHQKDHARPLRSYSDQMLLLTLAGPGSAIYLWRGTRVRKAE